MTSKTKHRHIRWSAKNFGSRRGLLASRWHQFLYLLGRYQSYKEIDWSKVDRLVFVCKGNICRSAYAEAVAHDLNIDSASFGLKTALNLPANGDAIITADKLGTDLSRHRTTTIANAEIRQTDLLLTMEPKQARILRKTFQSQCQLSLLGLWIKPALPHLHDPYGHSPEYFEKCFVNIQNAIKTIAREHLNEQA